MYFDKGFKFIDLFCGIGGFHQAMTALGGECVFASDIDTECRRVYAGNYGLVPNGDITKVDAVDIPPFNVLCGGFPCQAFSYAGKRLGFSDPTRGTLFFEIMRIARHHRPEFMLLENVKNLAHHDGGRTWGVIYDTIRGCGYNLLPLPTVFNPRYIGIPQNRERVFIMCVREDIGILPNFSTEGMAFPETSVWSVVDRDAVVTGYDVKGSEAEVIDIWDRLVRGVGGDIPKCPVMAEHIFPGEYGIDAKPWPSWAAGDEVSYRAWVSRHGAFLREWIAEAVTHTPFRNSRLHLEFGTSWDGPCDSLWNKVMQFRPSGLRVRGTDCFPALVAMVQIPIIGPLRRYATPRECALMQSFPDSFEIMSKDRLAYKQFGNSVNVEVVNLFARYMMGDPTVRSVYSTGVTCETLY